MAAIRWHDAQADHWGGLDPRSKRVVIEYGCCEDRGKWFWVARRRDGQPPQHCGWVAGVSAMRVSHLIKGKRPVNGELALRLGKVLGQSPQYWLNLQAAYDLAQAEAAIGRKLKSLHMLPQLDAA